MRIITVSTQWPCLSELVSIGAQFLLATAELRFRFKLYERGFGFYVSAFLSTEIMEDKSYNSCNSTLGPL